MNTVYIYTLISPSSNSLVDHFQINKALQLSSPWIPLYSPIREAEISSHRPNPPYFYAVRLVVSAVDKSTEDDML
jgi:hypothetical protein